MWWRSRCPITKCFWNWICKKLSIDAKTPNGTSLRAYSTAFKVPFWFRYTFIIWIHWIEHKRRALLRCGGVVGVQLQSVLGTEFAKQGKFLQKSKRFDMDICCMECSFVVTPLFLHIEYRKMGWTNSEGAFYFQKGADVICQISKQTNHITTNLEVEILNSMLPSHWTLFKISTSGLVICFVYLGIWPYHIQDLLIISYL